ncbi:MAG: hypothetical protein N2645_22570, partial [Clostridia bacterium]|nr:hypothetical protein [Clostridia bacterium]
YDSYMMPPVIFDLWLLGWQLTIQILQLGIYFFKVHLFSLQECSLKLKERQEPIPPLLRPPYLNQLEY